MSHLAKDDDEEDEFDEKEEVDVDEDEMRSGTPNPSSIDSSSSLNSTSFTETALVEVIVDDADGNEVVAGDATRRFVKRGRMPRSFCSGIHSLCHTLDTEMD